jgi:hypothetical protein
MQVEKMLIGSNGERFELSAHEYWCFAPTRISYAPDDGLVKPLDFGVLFHNAAIGEGYVNGLDVLLADLKPSSLKKGAGLDAENLLEEIRRKEFPNQPSRLRSYFLNQNKWLAEQRQQTLKRQPTRVARCYLIKQFCKVHFADMGIYEKLDGGALKPEIARQYWTEFVPKNHNEELRLEVLVEGDLYFPDWQSFELVDQNSLGLWNEVHSKQSI